LVGRVSNDTTKITLEVFSDQPGVQFYTSNFLPDSENDEPGIPGKNKAKYYKHGAFCLETQNYPNAINTPNFPSAVLNPGKVYNHSTIFKFTTSK
jgi:aldose 1-epimerase